MRWPRYTLRQLLIAVAAIAIGIAWWQGTFRSQKVRQTGRELDLAIDGQGFFEIKGWQGDTFYTRHGRFLLDASGAIGNGVTFDGRVLHPMITVPSDWTKIQVSEYGTVSVFQSGAVNASQVGQILLTKFMNPEGLNEISPGKFLQTSDSGPPYVATPSQGGLGYIKQGWLENIDIDSAPGLSSTDILLFVALALLVWLCIRIAVLERKLNQVQTLLAQNVVADAIDAQSKSLPERMSASHDTL